ncbi:kinase-like protein [Lichtheimia hyalospora FSU 10163]|nr:kinase-like protein [Lichtheimia hyalospora FSU 10163]
MFTHLKNLFKGNKKDHAPSASLAKHQQPASSTDSKRTLIVAEPKKLPNSKTLTAKQVIEIEQRRKRQLPLYPGLERFELIEKLGDGAFSIVYKARDTTNDQFVAIKVVRKNELERHGNTPHLHPSLKKKTRATERSTILKEVQIMQTCKHDNLVALVHFSESLDYYFLVMELSKGGELFHQIVKLTYFSEDLARHVIVQVAHAIQQLHERGIVHRDIKPENILFDPIPIIPSKKTQNLFDEDKVDEGEFTQGVGGGGIGLVKVADFGLSKVIGDDATKTPCGTVGYTAPEIVRDQRYHKGVDMWALGCVLYTMLCGFPPFYDESIPALTQKVAKGQYTFLSPWWDPISDSAKELITHLLCVDPNERYTVDEFLNHPWITQKKAPAISVPSVLTPPTPSTIPPDFMDTTTPSSGSRRRKDIFSPGVASIKEILDITYAVQRIGEEKAQQLGGLAEEDEEDEDEQRMTATHMPPAQGGFALDMSKATILKKRQKV